MKPPFVLKWGRKAQVKRLAAKLEGTPPPPPPFDQAMKIRDILDKTAWSEPDVIQVNDRFYLNSSTPGEDPKPYNPWEGKNDGKA